MAVSSRTRRSTRVRGTRSCAASAYGVMLRGARNSSRRISPGWIGARDFLAIASCSSMIVGNLNRFRVTAGPHEAEPVLIVNSDRVRSSANALQCFQVVTRHGTQVIEHLGAVEHDQLATGGFNKVSRNAFAPVTSFEDHLCIRILKGLDHSHPFGRDVSSHDTNVKATQRNGARRPCRSRAETQMGGPIANACRPEPMHSVAAYPPRAAGSRNDRLLRR